MAANVIVENQTVFESSGVAVMARLRLTDANYITQAAVTTIKRRVYHLGTIVGAETDLTVANVIFDTLQTDALWDKDDVGYNVKDVLNETALPDGDKVYEIWYYIVLASLANTKFRVRVHTIDDPSG